MHGGGGPRDQLVEELRREIAELEAVVAAHERTEHTLEQSEARFRRLFDSNVVGVMLSDFEGNVTEANDRFLHTVGYERADLPLRWDEMTPPEWRELDELKIREGMATGAALLWEKEYLHKDGSRVPILVGGALLDEASGSCLAVVLDLTERKQAERELEERQQQLRALTAELALAEERERRRLALGLHDQVGQKLAVAKLRLGRLRASAPSAETARALDEIDQDLAEAIRETRSLSFELALPVLYDLGLEAALESAGERLAEEHGIRFVFASDSGREPLLEEATRVTLFRAVEELLFNVVKHARARTARVAVAWGDDRIGITIEDDGAGIDTSRWVKNRAPGGGLGLFGVRERLAHLGGSVEIESAPGSGTRIVISAPLSSSPPYRRPRPVPASG